MKSFSLIKRVGTVMVLIAVVALLGSSVYGEAPALRIPTINGTVTYVNTNLNYVMIHGSDILGSDPLYLGSDTCVFKGYEGVDFDELNRNAKTISASNRLECSDLNAGDEVCCTYSYSKDGKLIAESIVIVVPSIEEVPSM